MKNEGQPLLKEVTSPWYLLIEIYAIHIHGLYAPADGSLATILSLAMILISIVFVEKQHKVNISEKECAIAKQCQK